MTKIETGALPYEDGSGFEVDILIQHRADDEFPEIDLSPRSDFCSFKMKDWPKVREAINNAVRCYKSMEKSN